VILSIVQTPPCKCREVAKDLELLFTCKLFIYRLLDGVQPICRTLICPYKGIWLDFSSSLRPIFRQY
jgi:hypothetical protein